MLTKFTKTPKRQLLLGQNYLSFFIFLLQCEMIVDVVFIKGIEHSGFTFEIMHRQKLRFDLSLNLIII